MARLNTALGRRYTIERELGRGGMGTLYLALDLKHGRQVAIKILPPDLAQAVGPDRFLREIEISARLTHPHILSVHDSGQAGGLLYYIMPYVPGESLRERLDRVGALPLDQTVQLAAELADALSYAHAQGVIHRDVKPDNVMLAGEHAFLADFGVAKALDRPSELTDSGLSVGTRRYASPEQAAGSRAVDARTDLYSLGCVLYEMLAGPAAAEALEHRLEEPLPALSRVRPDSPAWLGSLVARATAQRPAERFQTAAEFRAALLAGTPAAAPARPRRPARRWVLAGVTALALAAVAFALRPGQDAPLDPERVVVAGFENRTGDSALGVLGDIATDYIARGLAATHLTHDVYDARALALEGGRQLRLGAAAGRELANQVGAGTVLWGSFFREGNDLHFQAQLLEPRSGKVILALEPVVGSPAEQTRLVELLRQRVMAGLAVAISPDFGNWRAGSIPPTYDAYQEMLAGMAANWVFKFDEAIGHFRRAVSLDSTFTTAQSFVALTLRLLNDCAGVDSVARHLAGRLPAFPPVDRLQIEYAVAGCRKDPRAALAAARQMLEIAPLSASSAVLGAVEAMQAARPREAVDILLRFDPERAGLGGEPLIVYRDWLAEAYHALGLHREELNEVRVGLRSAPTAPHLQRGEATALAGLGRGAEAEALANGWLADHAPDDPWKGVKAQCVALELLAHGDSLRARALFQRVITWYGGDGLLAAAGDDRMPCLWDRFSPRYYLGDWAAARSGYERLLARDSASLDAHAALGALAARRGDREAVRRAEAWLTRRGNAEATASRARIALLLGERDRAMTLLRQAVDQGLNRLLYLHLDPDFAPLRDYPPFQDLLRPAA